MKTHRSARGSAVAFVAVGLLCLASTGCATYRTPAGGVELMELTRRDPAAAASAERKLEQQRGTDAPLIDAYATRPAASFPASVVMARVQAPGYHAGYQALRTESYGRGRYSVVTTRTVETDEQIKRFVALDGVAQAVPVTRMLLPYELDTLDALRGAAAHLKADLLLVYTIDTRFRVDSKDVGPLNVIFLGWLPTEDCFVTATASALIIDNRTGFIHGAAEGSATRDQLTNLWSTRDAIDNARVEAEKEAFAHLVDEVIALWPGMVAGQTAVLAPSASAE